MKYTHPWSFVLPIVALTGQPAFATDPRQPGTLYSDVYSNSAAEIFWQRSDDDGSVVGYEIKRNDTVVEMIDALSYFDSSLAPSTDYVYSVVAIDNEGNRSVAATTSLRTRSLLGASTSTLAAPTSLDASVYSQNAVELFWDRVSTQVLKYEIFKDGELINTTDGTSFYTDSLTAVSPYEFSVVAVDASGVRSIPL